jgi:hypothetical protein
MDNVPTPSFDAPGGPTSPISHAYQYLALNAGVVPEVPLFNIDPSLLFQDALPPQIPTTNKDPFTDIVNVEPPADQLQAGPSKPTRKRKWDPVALLTPGETGPREKRPRKQATFGPQVLGLGSQPAEKKK